MGGRKNKEFAMQGFSFNYALKKFLIMLTSRKFLVLLFAALAVSGLDIPAEWQAIAFMVAATIYAAFTAAEEVDNIPG